MINRGKKLTVRGLINLLENCNLDDIVHIEGCDCSCEVAGVGITKYGDTMIYRESDGAYPDSDYVEDITT